MGSENPSLHSLLTFGLLLLTASFDKIVEANHTHPQGQFRFVYWGIVSEDNWCRERCGTSLPVELLVLSTPESWSSGGGKVSTLVDSDLSVTERVSGIRSNHGLGSGLESRGLRIKSRGRRTCWVWGHLRNLLLSLCSGFVDRSLPDSYSYHAPCSPHPVSPGQGGVGGGDPVRPTGKRPVTVFVLIDPHPPHPPMDRGVK